MNSITNFQLEWLEATGTYVRSSYSHKNHILLIDEREKFKFND